MRAREFLSESSRGLLYRKPGDRFVNTAGQEATFVGVTYYPETGAYDTPQAAVEASDALDDITWVNKPGAAMRAFAVLELDQLGRHIKYGRWFAAITPDMAGKWKNNDLPGGWQLQTGASLKSSYKLKPTDLFAPNSSFSDPQQLIQGLQKSEAGAPFAEATAAMLSGKLPSYPDAADKETAIRDDLGEVIAPVALVQGLIKSTGAEQARQILNDNKPWSGTIRFPSGKTNGLIDSELVLHNGIVLGISSKGGGGATASIKNVYDGIATVKKTGDTTLLDAYPMAVKVATTLSGTTALDGPFELAKIVGREELSSLRPAIMSLIKSNARDLSTITDEGTRQQLADLMQRMTARTDNPRYSAGYHALAVIAVDVAAACNEHKEFGEGCLKLINAAPVIQIYAKTAKQGDTVSVTGFDAIYPPNFKGTIALDAGKVYYATGINGRYTFKFNPG